MGDPVETKAGRLHQHCVLQPQEAFANLHNSVEREEAPGWAGRWLSVFCECSQQGARVKFSHASASPSFPVSVMGWMTVEKVLWDHLTKP